MNVFTTRGVWEHNMQMETKYLGLRDSVEFGTRFGDWQICWIGGWARFRLYLLVMLVKIPLPAFPQGCGEATPIGACTMAQRQDGVGKERRR
jgi:hypothetical protein